jgi:hypothetical protein
MLISTSGCLERSLTKKLYEPNKYDETVISFLITEDGSKFVILGTKYHYIFDSSTSLKQVLMGSFRSVVDTQLSNFYITRDNVVTGDYTLSVLVNSSEEQQKSALNAGFTTDNTPGLSLSGHLKGIRYSTEGFPSIGQPHNFNRPYIVSITEQDSRSILAGKILLTPITVAADGALNLLGLFLIAIMLAS